ncbi:MAG: ATP-binding protein [Acidimicrobiia bacterium]|nr:ATP-binding protein [Acidimicrobiia bacterium]MYJ14037.1 ATP-binding protein [Acidimicrobiia bacterium]
MDPVANPYSPGAGKRPPALVGREAEIAAFDVAVRRLALGRSDRSQVLTGLRGVGKTVLLREFRDIAAGRGWACQHIEIGEGDNFVAQIAAAARGALLDLSPTRRLAQAASRVLGILKSFQLSWDIPAAGTLTLKVDPVSGSADSGILQRDLTDLLRAVAEHAGERDKGVVLTIDEIQHLPRDHLRPLVIALHEVGQAELPLLVAGAGLPSILGLLGEARTYAERLFGFVEINSLDEEAAARALAEPAAAEGVTWGDAALEEVLRRTSGYPYFLQEFGRQVWRMAEGPDRISRGDVLEAAPIAIAELDAGFFRVRMDRTTDTQRAYLSAMAAMGPGPYRSGDIAKALGRKTTQLAPVRQALIARGLCYSPRHDVLAFTVPAFDDFIRRRIK